MSQQQVPTFDNRAQGMVVPGHLELVVNVIDESVSFEICGNPGTPPAVFRLDPGQQAMIPKSYTLPIQGAGRDGRDPVLYMLTARDVYPGGPHLETVVPLERAGEARRRWFEARAKRPKVNTVMLSDINGHPVPLAVPAPHTAEQPAPEGDPVPTGLPKLPDAAVAAPATITAPAPSRRGRGNQE